MVALPRGASHEYRACCLLQGRDLPLTSSKQLLEHGDSLRGVLSVEPDHDPPAMRQRLRVSFQRDRTI
jgi:hypothetical protein